MGEEIGDTRFDADAAEAFGARLASETALLHHWARSGRLQAAGRTAGYELEAWLVDRDAMPLAANARFLAQLDDPSVGSELSRFNFELNGAPRALTRGVLRAIEDELADTWQRCIVAAEACDAVPVAIGILPTIRKEDLCLANISALNRYRALNAQVFAARRGEPIRLDIRGHDRLMLAHPDVMLEAAATSLQLHLQLPPDLAARGCNAASILAGPLVAIAANAPHLFGTALWEETRIPLFEQALDTGGGPRRVSFGDRYVASSLLELFDDNLARHAPLLPMVVDAPEAALHHLRLHNGTIWRWVRPLVGFDQAGEPHLRIEFRPLPAGPSLVDTVAHAALFYGAVQALIERSPAPESMLPFEAARANFYACARHGLEATVRWLDGDVHPVVEVLEQWLLPQARDGLRSLAIDGADADRCLAVLAERLRNRQNGAAWQRGWVARHGAEPGRLLAAYLANQQGGLPVHAWPL